MIHRGLTLEFRLHKTDWLVCHQCVVWVMTMTTTTYIYVSWQEKFPTWCLQKAILQMYKSRWMHLKQMFDFRDHVEVLNYSQFKTAPMGSKQNLWNLYDMLLAYNLIFFFFCFFFLFHKIHILARQMSAKRLIFVWIKLGSVLESLAPWRTKRGTDYLVTVL